MHRKRYTFKQRLMWFTKDRPIICFIVAVMVVSHTRWWLW